jgi:membrane-bound serine protease (ClpP class)
MHHLFRRALIVAFIITAASSCCRADTLETDDGKTFDGKIVDQNAATVTIEIRTDGMTFRRKFPAAKVKHITRDVADGPAYCPLPLTGDIGVELTADALSRAITEARKSNPQYIILVIDSPGGSGPEMVRIAQVLRDAQALDGKQIQYVAYVKRALSAAAVIAMTCPKIYFAADAVMGAGVPFRFGPDGTPANLEEKFASAARAQMRAAASSGGHNDLILRGMMEPELELVVTAGDDGKPEISEATAAPLFGTTPFKSKGRILTLTAPEAVQCGLAGGVAADVDGLHAAMGLSAWHKGDDAAWYVLSDAARQARAAARDRKGQRVAAAGDGPKESAAVTKTRELLKSAAAKADSAQKKLDSLKADYQKELDAAQDEYKQAIAGANSTANPVLTASAASHKKNTRIKKANEKYPPEIDAAQKAYEKAVGEYNDLVGRLNRALAAGE